MTGVAVHSRSYGRYRQCIRFLNEDMNSEVSGLAALHVAGEAGKAGETEARAARQSRLGRRSQAQPCQLTNVSGSLLVELRGRRWDRSLMSSNNVLYLWAMRTGKNCRTSGFRQ